MKVVAGFEPEYTFRLEKIENGKIRIDRDHYTREGGRIPVSQSTVYLQLKGNQLVPVK